MKLTIILCIICTLHLNYANGRLSDLFDGVHNKVHKVREDIHNFVFPKDKSDSGPNVAVPSTSESGSGFFFPTEKDFNANAPKPVTVVNKDDKQLEATTPSTTTQSATSTPSTTTQSATSTPSTTTIKQDSAPQTVETTTQKGRENFSGSCSPGYLRTPDGRCKATF